MFRRWVSYTLFFVLALFLFVVPVVAADDDRIDFPNPVGYVNDFANILTNDEEVEAKLRALDEAESTQVLVITTKKLPEEVYLENFIPRLTDNNPEWAAGQEKYDNGVIFTIVVDDRLMRIDVGYGLEGSLPDLLTQTIQDDYVRPLFRDGDYNGGVNIGVDKIIEAVKGEYTLEEVECENDIGDFLGQSFFCILVFMFIFLPYLGAFLGRTKSWWVGGLVGVVVGLGFGIWMALFKCLGDNRFGGLIGFPALTGPLGLLFDYVLSKNYKKLKKQGKSTGFVRSWGGFSSGSSSGGSSGGGGFSSGGGSFGGGGSSSSW